MFLGQIALAFAAKRLARKTSLGVLILAALLPDLIGTALVAAGVERVRLQDGGTALTPVDFVSLPYSHSLVMVLLFALVAAALYRARTGYATGSRAIFALVTGHWILEFVGCSADLPVVPGVPIRLGLGLDAVPSAMIPLMAALFVAGLAIYLDLTRPVRRVGRFGLLAMIGFASCLFLAIVSGAAEGGLAALIATSIATWALVPLGGWVDRNRKIPGAA